MKLFDRLIDILFFLILLVTSFMAALGYYNPSTNMLYVLVATIAVYCISFSAKLDKIIELLKDKK